MITGIPPKCLELHEALLSPVRGQPGAVGFVHPGLQPGELPEEAGLAQGLPGLVSAQPLGEADQDGGTAGAPRPAAGVPAR